MNEFRTALYDLFKYSVAQKVVTGDRPFDMLLQTLCLTLVGLFSIWNWKGIKVNCQEAWKRFRNQEITLTKENYSYYTDILNTMRFESKVMITPLYEYQMYRFFRDNNFFPFVKSRTMFKIKDKFIIGTEQETSKCIETMLAELIALDGRRKYPLYISRKGSVGVSIEANCKYLWFTNLDTEDKFTEILSAYKRVTLEQITNGHKQYILYPNHQAIIYPDRTFDHLITLYKPKILKMIDKFKEMNSPTNVINRRFGSYNLGFILYGKPGTGKTTLIKALCNKLGRDGQIVDMRTIKTKSDFEDLFDGDSIDKKIFIFEEFDCVQGIFDRKEHNISDEKKQLKEEHLKLLQLKMTSKKGIDTTDIDKQLQNIEKSIKDLENSLTIDTVLTVLDGVTEHRNRVIVATTNHIDRIDPALIREGRFDLKVKLEEFTHEETQELLIAYYGEEARKAIGDKVFPKQYTPVQLINLCRQYENIQDLFDVLVKTIKLE